MNNITIVNKTTFLKVRISKSISKCYSTDNEITFRKALILTFKKVILFTNDYYLIIIIIIHLKQKHLALAFSVKWEVFVFVSSRISIQAFILMFLKIMPCLKIPQKYNRYETVSILALLHVLCLTRNFI